MNYLDYDGLKFLINNYMKLGNRNYLINPDFRINQREGYITKSTYTLYTDEELTVEATDIELPEGLLTIDYLADNYAVIILNDITYYLNKNDIEKGYIGENKYTFDRWYIGEGSNMVKPAKDYIILGNDNSSEISSLYQFLNSDYKFENKTLTLTMKVRTHSSSNVTVELKDGINELSCNPHYTGDWEIISVTLNINTNYIQISAGIKTSGIVDIAWAKLEIGNYYTTFEYPEPSIELIKCKYYYQQFSGRFEQLTFMTSTPYIDIPFQKMIVDVPKAYFKYPNLINAYSIKSQGGAYLKLKINSFNVLFTHPILENQQDIITLQLPIAAKGTCVIISGYNPFCLDAEILPLV